MSHLNLNILIIELHKRAAVFTWFTKISLSVDLFVIFLFNPFDDDDDEDLNTVFIIYC